MPRLDPWFALSNRATSLAKPVRVAHPSESGPWTWRSKAAVLGYDDMLQVDIHTTFAG